MKRDHNAAIKIQRMWRRHVVRSKYIRIQEACLTIQRYMRGYLSWKYSEKLRYLERERMNVCFFDFHASLIQKVFRGYYFRKYVHSYYHRQKCLLNIKKQNAKVLEEIRQYQENQAKQIKQDQEEQEKETFEKLASKLHHLISTETIPGVYNPPFGIKQKAYGEDVESHLKTVFQKSFKWKPPTRDDLVKHGTARMGTNEGKRPPIILKKAGQQINIVT